MHKVLIMLYILYQSSVFDDVAKLIKQSLIDQGLHPIITNRVKPQVDDYYIILGAHDLYDKLPSNYEVV